MDKRLAFQTVAQTTDAQGGYTEVWSTSTTLWGQLKPLKGYEKFQFSQNETQVTHEAIVRYTTGITTGMRFTFDSRTFYIKEILNVDEAKVYLKILAMESV